MIRSIHIRNPAATTARLACVVLVCSSFAVAADTPRKITPLPKAQAAHPAAVELGKMLFFDQRLSGDARISCATCHDPAKGWADGAPLSAGYPGTRYFRNTPTVMNAARADYFHWDGRLGGDDLPTLVRDSINDSHFLSADGRIILERMKQVPEYVELFRKAELGEPSLTAITRAIAAFVASLNSENVPFDKFLKGDQSAISLQAKQGFTVFSTKANCIQCHDGPYLSDQRAHNLGVPENPQVFNDPLRAITFRSQLKSAGTPNYMNLRKDPGRFAVTKDYRDLGKFITPTLREVSRTAPYMHNGMLPTLESVVDFYDRGGGRDRANQSKLLKPLGLTEVEKTAIVEFLNTLSGDPIVIRFDQKDLPKYRTIDDWYRKEN